jgi:hypothetical protein
MSQSPVGTTEARLVSCKHANMIVLVQIPKYFDFRGSGSVASLHRTFVSKRARVNLNLHLVAFAWRPQPCPISDLLHNQLLSVSCDLAVPQSGQKIDRSGLALLLRAAATCLLYAQKVSGGPLARTYCDLRKLKLIPKPASSCMSCSLRRTH